MVTNIVPDPTNKMEEDHLPMDISEQLERFASAQELLGLDESLDLTDCNKPQTLIDKLSSLLGWRPNTKPDNELLVKLYHFGVKMLR